MVVVVCVCMCACVWMVVASSWRVGHGRYTILLRHYWGWGELRIKKIEGEGKVWPLKVPGAGAHLQFASVGLVE